MTVLPSPEAMIVICTVILIAYTAHVLDKAFASSEQFEAMLSARDKIIGLQTENDKLREERREYQATIDSLVDECDDHKAENDRLRVLVRDMWNWLAPTAIDGGAPLQGIAAAMRELGIEVDGE